MSTIWLDVTTILSWQRPAVGVVRVEAECAAHALQKSSEKIKFCRFGAGGYDEVDRLVVRDALYRIQGKSASKQKVQKLEAPSVQEHTEVPFEQRFKSMVLRLIDMLPAKQRQTAFGYKKYQGIKRYGVDKWISEQSDEVKKNIERNKKLVGLHERMIPAEIQQKVIKEYLSSNPIKDKEKILEFLKEKKIESLIEKVDDFMI